MPEKHDLLAAILAAKEQGIGAILAFAMAYLRGRYNSGAFTKTVIDATMCAIIAQFIRNLLWLCRTKQQSRLYNERHRLHRYWLDWFATKRFAAKKAGEDEEINNVRRSSDMLAWSEGIFDNGRQKTRNHGYDVIVGGELFTDYLTTLANLSR